MVRQKGNWCLARSKCYKKAVFIFYCFIFFLQFWLFSFQNPLFRMLSKRASCMDTDQTILRAFWSFRLETNKLNEKHIEIIIIYPSCLTGALWWKYSRPLDSVQFYVSGFIYVTTKLNQLSLLIGIYCFFLLLFFFFLSFFFFSN